jgi:hypothetical protein
MFFAKHKHAKKGMPAELIFLPQLQSHLKEVHKEGLVDTVATLVIHFPFLRAAVAQEFPSSTYHPSER